MWDSMEYAQDGCEKMLARAPEHARSIYEAYSSKYWVRIMQTCLRQLTLHTCVMWKSDRDNRVKLEVFPDPDFGCVSGEWTRFDVEVGDSSLCLCTTPASALTLPFIENR